MARNFMVTLLQFRCRHAERASNCIGISLVIQRAPQIHNLELIAVIHHPLQFLHRDTGDSQLPQKQLSMDELVQDVGDDPCAEDEGQP